MSDDSTKQPRPETDHGAAVEGVSAEGLSTVRSAWSVPDTIARIEAAVVARGAQVFARIDHAGGAAQVGLALRPTMLLIFGHPKGGTPLMQAQQTAGLDLPLRALAWEDAQGRVWLTYNAIPWLARRHGLGPETDAAVSALAAAQEGIIGAAAAPAEAGGA
jgi:uncharacterized protein (DUF302 family)